MWRRWGFCRGFSTKDTRHKRTWKIKWLHRDPITKPPTHLLPLVREGQKLLCGQELQGHAAALKKTCSCGSVRTIDSSICSTSECVPAGSCGFHLLSCQHCPIQHADVNLLSYRGLCATPTEWTAADLRAPGSPSPSLSHLGPPWFCPQVAAATAGWWWWRAAGGGGLVLVAVTSRGPPCDEFDFFLIFFQKFLSRA
jgi:hypothetical protein